MKKRKKTTLSDIPRTTLGIYLLIALLFILVGYLCNKCANLQDEITTNHQTHTTDFRNLFGKYTTLQDEVIANRKIYVYNLEEVLTKTGIIETKKEFEENLIRLNEELIDGQKRIKSLRDARVKEDFSEIYLNNLRSKRDDLVNHYDNKLDELAGKINKALAELCKEKNIPTVYLNSTVAITTDDVVDITDEVLEKINKQ